MPLSLKVRAPMRMARQKLATPPIMTTIGKGNAFPMTAEVYIPTPKNAAGAREIYPVGPENITQLTVRTTYIRMLLSNTTG
jgi:hypothetical protein